MSRGSCSLLSIYGEAPFNQTHADLAPIAVPGQALAAPRGATFHAFHAATVGMPFKRTRTVASPVAAAATATPMGYRPVPGATTLWAELSQDTAAPALSAPLAF
jgi:hypothetical protein